MYIVYGTLIKMPVNMLDRVWGGIAGAWEV